MVLEILSLHFVLDIPLVLLLLDIPLNLLPLLLLVLLGNQDYREIPKVLSILAGHLLLVIHTDP